MTVLIEQKKSATSAGKRQERHGESRDRTKRELVASKLSL